jgi:hypothetical protein
MVIGDNRACSDHLELLTDPGMTLFLRTINWWLSEDWMAVMRSFRAPISWESRGTAAQPRLTIMLAP